MGIWPWYASWYYYPSYTRYCYLGGYGTSYYDGSYTSGYVDGYATAAAETNNVPADNAAGNPPASSQPEWPDTSSSDPASSAAYRTGALTAFRRGDYRQATRLASHALVDAPQDAKAHELLSLALFAAGEYRGAAMEAHAAASLGPVSDWANLFAYYGDASPYTKQLRALEDYVGKNPSAPEAHFLLGYHYMMSGNPKEAKAQFTQVVTQAPRDQLAANLLKKLDGGQNAPATTETKRPAVSTEINSAPVSTESSRSF